MMLNKDVLTITVTRNLNNFSCLAIDDPLTLELEDLPPVTLGVAHFQVG
jgi:hypothetical protein